jgi:hypothetical protein
MLKKLETSEPKNIRQTSMKKSRNLFLIICMLLFSGSLMAQGIPDEHNGVIYRGESESIARGVLDGNLIQTNFRNHGEFSRWNDIPWGVWPRDIGGRHIDGVGVIIAGFVDGNRSDYPEFYGGAGDTLLNPVIINYRQAGLRQSPFTGEAWGWLPLPGFNNPERVDPVTSVLTPTPALSTDPNSWPEFWPDRLNEDDAGWPGTWNGRDGRLANADQESFYVMDDFSDDEYAVDPETGEPYSPFGVYYPSPQSDSTMGGLGLQMQVRVFQWANILAEDTMFLIYRITNKGDFDQERLYFVQIVDYGLGNEEDDDNAAYDPLLDVVYGWDRNGIGTPTTGGGNYELGYTGFAFLESPADSDDLVDADQDGITDESRFDNNIMTPIEGQAAIEAEFEARYDREAFENYYGPLEERPAYIAGIWYPEDEELDWVGFSDDNNNGVYDQGELVNDDYGRDGLGPFDLDYVAPDEGEADGMPTQGEPNFNELDVDESDQIGLTGFDLNTRPFYESGNNLRDDTWLFERIVLSKFPLGQEPVQSVADDEPFALFMSGEVQLASENTANGKSTDFFSTAWIFGNNEEDFFKNRRTVQNIYNADYTFAQPPTTPILTADAGDRRVVLSWDEAAVDSYDRFLQEFDFEGFKLFRSTNNVFTDARTITDVNGTPTYYDPIAQFDLDNDISGTVPVLGGDAIFDLGSNTGLQFNYVDTTVTNGKTYYYAIVAYDRGFQPDDGSTALGIDPQENTFNISVDLAGNVTATSSNAAVVVPKTNPLGYQQGGSTADLSSLTTGDGTGRANVNVVAENLINEANQYQVNFFDTASTSGDFRNTSGFEMVEVTNSDTLIPRTEFATSTSVIDGFTFEMDNNQPAEIIDSRTGYISNAGTENEIFSLNPNELDGLETNWVVTLSKTILTPSGVSGAGFIRSDSDFELTWVGPNDEQYRPPVILGGQFDRIDIPVFARNISTDEDVTLLVIDGDENGELSPGDNLIVTERAQNGQYRYRYNLQFNAQGDGTPPSSGDKIRISSTRAFGNGDSFQFGVTKASIDNELASSQLDDIYVAPNPYIGAAEWERSSGQVGRGERKIYFYNLPRVCTIRIFNVRGELINTLNHDGALDDGAISWDLRTANNEDIAYGVYFYHVSAEGIGEYVDKFAIVK